MSDYDSQAEEFMEEVLDEEELFDDEESDETIKRPDNYDNISGITADEYKLALSKENITAKERKEAIERPIQRIYSSIAGMDFTLGNDATPRIQMFCSHSSQRLVFDGMTPKNIINGTEQEFGKYNFRIDVKQNCIIRKVFKLYNPKLSSDNINYNPKTYVVVQLTDRNLIGHFDVIVLEDYFSMHQHFGFRYKDGKDLWKISEGSSLLAGDVLKQTPSTTDNGDYMGGKELKTIMMTHRSVAEDGIGICSDILPHFASNSYEERTVSFGKKRIALNLYGDDDNYKIFPEIGEYVRSDDILMATRENDEEVAISMQNKYSTQIIDHIFDESIYVVGGGRVISLDVVCNNEAEGRISVMENQIKKYYDQSIEFYKNIIILDKKLRHEFHSSYRPSPALNNLVVQALLATNINNTTKISRLYRKVPMDDYTVKFIVEKKITPNYGFKFTDTRGRKGVCCAILPPEQMPRDKNGVRADIIVDPIACINRMTMGAPIEAGINVITDIVVRNIREALGININSASLRNDIKIMANNHDERFEKAWKMALDYYQDIAPQSMYPKAKKASQKDKATVITYAAKHTLGLYLPPENAVNFAECLYKLHQKYNTSYESVTYKDARGNLIQSKDPMPISDIYMLLLEKIGDDRSACSSVRFQVFGVPATISKHDRYTTPFRWQINKNGESEARPLNSITRPSVHPELHDRNNNPKTAELCYKAMLRAENPSKIEKLIDRSKHPFGFTMPLQILNHFMLCSGYEFYYKNDNPGLYTYAQMVEENK